MSQPLDLSITLSAPPENSPSDIIARFKVNCETVGLTSSGDLLTNLLTDEERSDLRWYLEDYWKWPYEQFAVRGKYVEGLLVDIGKRLYRAVFGSVDAKAIVEAWQVSTEVAHQISIISDVPRVLSFPWELLHDEHDFLVLRTSRPISLVRRLSRYPEDMLLIPFESPLRILLVTARPKGTGFVDPRGIARELLDQVERLVETGAVEVEFLRPPTMNALRERLQNDKHPIHILHFDGHGASENGVEKQGTLAFEDKDGWLDSVQAQILSQALQDSQVQLVVLTACQSAMSTSDDLFSSVAAQLLQGGVHAVIAMSMSILVASATYYVEVLYHELADGISVPIAHKRACQSLHNNPQRHLYRRRWNEEGNPVELHDWWMPHFYQQNSLVLQPTATRKRHEASQQAFSISHSNLAKSTEPQYGFIGRASELFEVERSLQRGKLVVIYGFSGIGKTTLACEVAKWLTRTKMYDGSFSISFEQGGNVVTLLSGLGQYLNINDSNYAPDNLPSALTLLSSVLKQRRILVIADNLESILPKGEAHLEEAARTQLWDVLLELVKMGVGVVLTSTNIAFSYQRLTPGKQVMYLKLNGLDIEDAYILATEVMTSLEVDRKSVPYAELYDLLAQLEGHPLAIQLVISMLGDWPLAKIWEKYPSLLLRFVYDKTTEDNKPPLVLLDSSFLHRLSAEQNILLARLAPFEGRATEDDLLTITEIPKHEWVELRSTLEQAGLLTVGFIDGAGTPLFIRFHPVLKPLVRSLPRANDWVLLSRFTSHYHERASYFYFEDHRRPHEVRILAAQELPNFWQAFDTLLETNELDAAVDMFERMSRFYDIFGLTHERDQLQRRLTEVVEAKSIQANNILTQAELVHESSLARNEFTNGNLSAALVRYTRLLARIEALPKGMSNGPESFEHSTILVELARCNRDSGQIKIAEKQLSKALSFIEALIRQQPNEQLFIRHRSIALTDFASVLLFEGRYSVAQKVYEEALKLVQQRGDLVQSTVILSQLGLLALKQRNYDEARLNYTLAYNLYRSMNDHEGVANILYELGIVSKELREWDDAERYCRESLEIREQLGAEAESIKNYNLLSSIAIYTGRADEAEGWLKRAKEIGEQVQLQSPEHARILNNLAGLLLQEVQANHAPINRLAEARIYAAESLAIRENFDVSSETWTPLYILAEIAKLEGQTKEEQNYRRREHEAFAAFAGHRQEIDQEHRSLIAAIVAATSGNEQARMRVEAFLSQLSTQDIESRGNQGQILATAIRRIWAGEREWNSLADGLYSQNALLLLRVLEILAQVTEFQDKSPEQVIASLPLDIRNAMEQDDLAAFQRALQILSPEEQQRVIRAVQYVQAQEEEEFAQEIAEAIVTKDATQWNKSEATLANQKPQLREVVLRIKAGERDEASLTGELDEQYTALVRRVLKIVSEE